MLLVRKTNGSLTAVCGFKKSIWHGVFPRFPRNWSPRASRISSAKAWRDPANVLASIPHLRCGWCPVFSRCGWCEWLTVYKGGRAASQPQHQHPQADHVGSHVPPHGPGWALRCGTCAHRAGCDRLGQRLLAAGHVETRREIVVYKDALSQISIIRLDI